jgi:Ca2+-binding EF-hand superfamily protein
MYCLLLPMEALDELIPGTELPTICSYCLLCSFVVVVVFFASETDLDGEVNRHVGGNEFIDGRRVSDGALSLYAELHQHRSAEALLQERKIALTDLFHCIDDGGDGSVEEEELERFLYAVFPPTDNKDMQAKQIKLMIEGLDEDGDGVVTLVEFLKLMEPVIDEAEKEETSEAVCERMFAMLDYDDDKSVSISEFLEMLRKVGMDMSYEEVRIVFGQCEENGCV